MLSDIVCNFLVKNTQLKTIAVQKFLYILHSFEYQETEKNRTTIDLSSSVEKFDKYYQLLVNIIKLTNPIDELQSFLKIPNLFYVCI